MKKQKKIIYDFDYKKEFSIYNNIGNKNATYQNYCEWHDHVQKKYCVNKYTKATLNNFLHYLKREQNFVKDAKDVWSNCILPSITIFLSVTMTLIFSLVNVITNYNHAINTIYDKDYMQQFGYNFDMLVEALEQNLYSGVYFYLFGAFFTILFGLIIFCIISDKIKSNNQKYYFYCDYIEIIKELLEEQTPNKE